MRTHHPRALSLGAGALALLTIGLPASARGDLEDLIPGDVFFFGSFAGLEASSQAAEGLGLYQLWREPEMQAVVAPLLEAYGRAVAETPPQVLQEWEMFKAAASGRLSFAVGGINLLWSDDGPVPAPGAVLSLETPDGSDELRAKFTQVREAFGPELRREGVRIQDRELAGYAVTEITIREDGVTFPLFVAFLDDQVLVGFNRFLIEKCLVNTKGGAQHTLAQSEPFRRARSKAGANPLVELFFNTSAFTSRVRGLMPEEVLTALSDLGLDSLNAVYMASAVHNGMSSDTVYLDAPAPRTGLLNLSGKQGLSRAALTSVPRDAAYFTAGRCDLGAAWDVVMGTVENVAPLEHVQQLHAGLAMAEGMLGFSIREELLEALGNELVLYAELPRGGLIPNVVLSVAMEDGEEFEMILDRLLMMGEVELRAIEVEGRVLNMIQIPDAPFAPAYTVEDDRLVMALTVAGLKSALRHDTSESVLDSADFASTFKGLPLQHAASIEYIDVRRLAAYGYNVLENMGPGAVPPEVPLDLALLPSQETVLGHLGGWGTISVADKDGLVMRSRSLGLSSLLALASRFLMEADGCPPFAMDRLDRVLHNRDHDHGPRHRSVKAVNSWSGDADVYGELTALGYLEAEPGSEEEQPVLRGAMIPAPAPPTPGLVNPVTKTDPRYAELEQRLVELNRAVEADPGNAGVLFERGLVNSQLSNFEKAMVDYHRANEAGADAGLCNYNMACTLSLMGRKDEALSLLELSLKNGFDRWSTLARDTDLDPLRKDPRFSALLERFQDGA